MKYVLSDTVGLVNNRRGGCAVRYETSAYPHFMRLLNKWLCERATGLEQGPVFTSITINKGYAGRIHRDKNNAGPSFIKSFGDFTGGELRYFPGDDRDGPPEGVLLKGLVEEELDIHSSLYMIDGTRAHGVKPFEGERYSVVFYCANRYERLEPQQIAQQEAQESN